MSDEAPEKSGRTWLWAAGFLMGLPLLYVLSCGPMVVLYHRGIVPLDAVATTYAPIEWLAAKGLEAPLQAYVQAWMTLTGTPQR